MLLSEIAKQASVSTATVSRAINQPEIVAPDSLARIRAVMERHAYVPVPLERRRGPKSRERKPLLLGVWFVGAKVGNPNLSWFHDHITELMERRPRRRIEFQMLFSNSAHEIPRSAVMAKLDGIIIQGQQPTAEAMEKLGSLPCIWFMTRRNEDYPGDYVEPNNRENGRMAADFLARRGHRHVTVMTTHPEYSANVFREEAFLHRAAERGMHTHRISGAEHPRVSYIEISPLTGEIERLVQRLQQLSPRPSGIYLPMDHFAGAFFRALRTSGMKYERDFEVILGNYNPLINNNLEYHPAAIDINLPTLVHQAIDLLVWRIENPDTPGRVGISVSPLLREVFD